MHYSAQRGLATACRPSVRPFLSLSVCPSVCDVGGSGSHRLQVLVNNCTDNQPYPFAIRSPKTIHLLPGEHREILGRLEVGWEKVVCWSIKAAISQKRVKIEEKLLWKAFRNSTTLFRTVPSPTPYTGWAKKSKPDNFCNNFVYCQPIFIIFGRYTL